ncbi:MAG: hypothetical protein ACOCVA_00155 [Prolixibacteraceae bacterium]
MSEKDYIEKLMEDNLEELNDNEPGSGHFDRFEEKLKKQNRKKIFSLNTLLKVAAAVVFVLLIANQAFIYLSSDSPVSIFTPGEKQEEFTLASVSPEYKEVEFYFSNAIGNGLDQWENMVESGSVSSEEQQMMSSELSEFEYRYEKLQNDLAANPNDERVINAMLEYYQTKLSVINMIVNKLEEVKRKKNDNHEIEM